MALCIESPSELLLIILYQPQLFMHIVAARELS